MGGRGKAGIQWQRRGRSDRGAASEPSMSAFPFYSFDSPEYTADFQTLLGCLGERTGENALLDELASPYDRGAVAVDWGAGSGAMTRRLLERFDTVFAVEPSEPQRRLLRRNCPTARIIAGTLQTDLPAAVDFG